MAYTQTTIHHVTDITYKHCVTKGETPLHYTIMTITLSDGSTLEHTLFPHFKEPLQLKEQK